MINGQKLYPWDIAKIYRNRVANMDFEFSNFMSKYTPDRQPKCSISVPEVDEQSVKDAANMINYFFNPKDKKK